MSEQPPTSAQGSDRPRRHASGTETDQADGRSSTPEQHSTGSEYEESRSSTDDVESRVPGGVGDATPEHARLPPRPVYRPPVDAVQESVFGRPDGVTGSFDSRRANDVEPEGLAQQEPPSTALTEAFGRPADGGTNLQRSPGEHPLGSEPAQESLSWDSADYTPWRDPSSGAVLGPPAVHEEQRGDHTDRGSGPLLSAREVLFGRRVQPRALATLTAVALIIGLGGGFLGRITAEEGNPLTNPDVTLSNVEPGADRPAGSVASVAQQIVPAVVSVEVQLGAQGGSGSGVLIDGEGYVITNNHVVSMAMETPNSEVTTVFEDGTRVPARVVGRDVKTDLAVLKVEVANPTVAQLGESDSLSVGDEVLAVGSPLGLSGTVTTGIVSSVHRPVRLAGEGTDTNAVIDAIQTDAAINPGNSGGALVNREGAVVAINSAIRTVDDSGEEGGSIGLGFAIPIEDARRIAQELIRTGQVRHADIGVNAKSVSDGLEDGAQVQNVRDRGPAAAAGIAEGDVITEVGDRRVRGADELVVAVDRHRIGEAVPVTVIRQGRELVLDVTL